VNSKSVADDINRVLGGTGRVEVLYNAVDWSRFTPHGPALDLDEAAGMAPAPAGTIRVGLVATYARWKGHEVFLEAVARLDRQLPVRGYLVGGPVYQIGASQWSRQELAARVTALGLDGRVGLVGFQQDTAPVYRALDVVVHASTSPEPFGLVIAEAMMCGRAVVVSAAGGAIEVAGEDGALSHAPGDVAGLAQRLEQLVSSADLRSQLGARARTGAADRFSRDHFARGLDRVLG
jgi:glycosyltransferase involved in cell wall biosynthesis